MDNSEELKKQLKEALSECALLKADNARLKKLLDPPLEKTPPPSKINFAEHPIPYSPTETINNNSSPEAKVALFRNLFRGREDVYPVRWERKDGRSGYSPACALEWKKPLCGKPVVKCAACENKKFLPLTDEVIRII